MAWYERAAEIVQDVWDWFADPDAPDWRSWLGHSLVWVLGFEGAGAVLGLVVGWVVALVGLLVGYDPWVGLYSVIGAVVGGVGGLVFYGHRELWPETGDLWKHRRRPIGDRGGVADSKMDLWIPLIVATACLAAYASAVLY